MSALTDVTSILDRSSLVASPRNTDSELSSSSFRLVQRVTSASASASWIANPWKNASLSDARWRLINARAWAGANSLVLALALSCRST